MLHNERGYWLIDIPALTPDAQATFDDLPVDAYVDGKQRYRRFTAYQMSFKDMSWRLDALPPRPFLQPKSYNALSGGVPRLFEPLKLDPTPQMSAVANAIGLDKALSYALNVHQIRVLANDAIKGIVVPEGPLPQLCKFDTSEAKWIITISFLYVCMRCALKRNTS